MPKSCARLPRLLQLLDHIRANPNWNVRELATEFDVAPRTLFRDLKSLQAAGIPVVHDGQNGGYHIERDIFLKPVDLTFDEALALTVVMYQLASQKQVPMIAPAAKAITKIKSQLPLTLRQELDTLSGRVDVQLARSETDDEISDVYEKIQMAIRKRTMLWCEYESVGSEKPDKRKTFAFCPYTLFYSKRAWYVVGHHERHDQVRSLKLSRFSMVQPTARKYTIPKKFSLQRFLGNAWRMIPSDKTHKVEISFSAEFADNVAETQWHPTQQTTLRNDGTLLFRCTVDGLDEIIWWVLSMGPHCRVRKPAELARRVKQLSAQTANQYA